MHRPAVTPLIYSRLFPRPQPTDPVDFNHFVSRYLVPEVRAETERFYGSNDGLERKYPGLDYAKPAHRLRLRAFTWHRRLFRAFDELRLSDSEIHSLCRWEGTKWSKEHYEREHGMRIQDTTWEGVKPYGWQFLPVTSIRAPRSPEPHQSRRSTRREHGQYRREAFYEVELPDEASENDDEVITNSVGAALHQRLVTATAARARGEDAVLDSAWEQYLKEDSERRSMNRYHASPSSTSSPRRLPAPRYHSSARWSQSIPEVFRYGPNTPMPPALSHVTDTYRRMAPPPLLPSSRLRLPRPTERR